MRVGERGHSDRVVNIIATLTVSRPDPLSSSVLNHINYGASALHDAFIACTHTQASSSVCVWLCVNVFINEERLSCTVLLYVWAYFLVCPSNQIV